jgi:hypothetical protein
VILLSPWYYVPIIWNFFVEMERCPDIISGMGRNSKKALKTGEREQYN